VERILGLPVLAVVPDLNEGPRGYGYSYRYGYGDPQEGDAPEPAAPAGRRARRVDRKKAAADVPIELLPHHRPRLAVSEAYRALRTGLLLSTARELKIVSVTSVEAGEGKTATASNLSVVLAQLGKRVLLVDADLRKPRLHKVFAVSNQSGLVTYLTTGGEEGIVHRTPVAGLSLMPSGPIPPNPSELLASDRMWELLERLRSAYDYVVFDTPPTLAVTDSTVIGARSDGVILCVRAAQVDRRDAARAVDRLRMADIRLLGAVLNAYRSGGGSGYRYYESYAAPAPARSTDSAA
jgi:capsular exopolysaccharide synthesis family protein